MKSLPVCAHRPSMSSRAASVLWLGLAAPALLAVAALMPRPALAADGGATPEQAVAMVKKGVAFIKKEGKEKGYAEISVKGGAVQL